MAEPSSTLQALPAVVLGGTTVASAFPGVDPLCVIGAAAGAAMFVTVAIGITESWRKVVSFFVSWIFGYLFGVGGSLPGWLSSWLPETSPSIKAFFAALIIVTVCTGIMEFFSTGKWPKWITEVINLRRGTKGESDV